jgi:hypothetical protein
MLFPKSTIFLTLSIFWLKSIKCYKLRVNCNHSLGLSIYVSIFIETPFTNVFYAKLKAWKQMFAIKVCQSLFRRNSLLSWTLIEFLELFEFLKCVDICTTRIIKYCYYAIMLYFHSSIPFCRKKKKNTGEM